MICTAVFAIGLLQSRSIDLNLEAMRLPKLLEAVAKATGKRLECGAELKDEVLLVSVKGVSATELLDRVATAASASWSELEGGKLLLARPKTIEDAQRKAWAEERLVKLEATVAAFQANAIPEAKAQSPEDVQVLLHRMQDATMRPPFADQNQFILMRALHEKLPAGRLFARLMGLVDLRKIASTSDKVVFCSQPNQAQSAFQSSVQEPLDLFRDEQTQLANAIGKLASSPIILRETGGADADFFTAPMRETPAKVRLLVFDRGAEWRVTLFSAEGKTLFEFHFSPTTLRNLAAEIDPSLLPFSAKLLTLPPDCSAFNATLRGDPDGPSKVWQPARGTLREKLLKPEEFDPLSFSASATIRQILDATQANFVGSVPDSFLFGTDVAGKAGALLKLKLDKGWLTSRPSDYASRIARTPRAALGEFAREVARAGAATIDAKLVLSRAGLLPLSVAGWPRTPYYYEIALGAPVSAETSIIAATLLEGLSAEQKQTLEKGGSLRFGDLPARIREKVHRLAATTQADLRDRRQLIGAQLPHIMRTTWRSEATQSWEKEIPAEAELRATVSRNQTFLNLDFVPRMSLGVSNLAFSLAQISKGSAAPITYAISHRLLVGETVQVAFELLHEDLLLRAAIEGLEIPAGSVGKVYKELNPDVTKGVEEMKARYIAAGGLP